MIARARELSPLVQVALLLAVVVVAYYVSVAVIAALPLAVASAHAGRVRTGRRSSRRPLVTDALFATGGFLLGRRRQRAPGGPVKVRGETYATAAAARRASRDLFAQAGNVPSESSQWRSLIDHAIDLERAAWESEQ